MKSGTLLRQVINKLNEGINFNRTEDRHLFGDIYEQILRDLQSAGNAGESQIPNLKFAAPPPPLKSEISNLKSATDAAPPPATQAGGIPYRNAGTHANRNHIGNIPLR